MDDWERTQERVFTAWINSTLQRHPSHMDDVEDLLSAFADGVQLIRLVEVLSGREITARFKSPATTRFHRIENLNLGLQFARETGLREDSSTVVPEDFLDGIYPQIAGFVWMLFKTSQQVDDSSSSGCGSPDAELLSWCTTTAAMVSEGVVVSDFHSSFRDGRALAAIVAASDPPAHPMLLQRLNQPTQPDGSELVGLATAAAASSALRVPELIEPAAIRSGEADLKSMQVYVAMLCKRWRMLADERTAAAPQVAARQAEVEAALVAVRAELSTEVHSRLEAERKVTAAETLIEEQRRELVESRARPCEQCAALQAELDALAADRDSIRAKYEAALQEASANLEAAAQRHQLEQQALHDQLASMTAEVAALQADRERSQAELHEVKQSTLGQVQEQERHAQALAQTHATELGRLQESEQCAVASARQSEKEAAASATEVDQLHHTVREITRQAKAAVEDGRVKVESAALGREALLQEQVLARMQLDAVATERSELAASAHDLVHYAMTAFWAGNATLPYGAQISGWLEKMSVEKSKDKRDDTAGQVAKKHSKQAKNWGRDMLDRTWKRRWFVLSGGCLYYYKSPEDASANPKGYIFLHNAQIRAAAFPSTAGQWWQGASGHGAKFVRELGEGDDLLSIRVVGHSVSLNLRAQNEAERIAWGTALQKHIAFCDYLDRCWSEADRPPPSPHLAQLLLDVAPSDGIGGQAAAQGKLTAGHTQDVKRIAVPPGSNLGAAASVELLTALLQRATHIETLALPRAVMDGAGVVGLARTALPQLRTLTELDLSEVTLRGDAVHCAGAPTAVLQALPHIGGTLATLRLDGMPLESGASSGALGGALSALETLKTLSLVDCKIGEAGFCASFGAVCPRGHHLVPEVASDCFCDGCAVRGVELIGTAFRCGGGCDYDLCSQCFSSGCHERRALPAALTTLDLRSNGLTGVRAVCGHISGNTLRVALKGGGAQAKSKKKSKAPEPGRQTITATVAVPKGERGFGMMLSADCQVASFSGNGSSAAELAGVALGSRIVAVNGTPTPNKSAIASLLSPLALGAVAEFQLEMALPEPPSRPAAAKPKPPKPHESVPPTAAAANGDPPQWGSLSAALMGTPNLVRLDLGDNPLGCDGVKAILGLALADDKHHPALRHLGLTRTGIADAGLKAVAALLSKPGSTVCAVDVGGNVMTGSLVGGVGFGREGRGPAFFFEKLLLRR